MAGQGSGVRTSFSLGSTFDGRRMCRAKHDETRHRCHGAHQCRRSFAGGLVGGLVGGQGVAVHHQDPLHRTHCPWVWHAVVADGECSVQKQPRFLLTQLPRPRRWSPCRPQDHGQGAGLVQTLVRARVGGGAGATGVIPPALGLCLWWVPPVETREPTRVGCIGTSSKQTGQPPELDASSG